MEKRTLILVVALLLFSFLGASFGEAAVTSRIKLTNCGFTTLNTTFACGSSVAVYCNANVTGATGLNTLSFTVGSSTYNGALFSGNSSVGQWRASIPVSSGSAVSFNLVSVSGQDSSYRICTASGSSGTESYQTYESSECYIEFSRNNTGYSSCTCTHADSPGACNANIRLTTRTPSSGCANQSVVTLTSACNVCDPQWVVGSLICDMNRTQSLAQYQDPLRGTAVVEWEDLNPSCCATTHLDEDCTPPSSTGSSVSCRLDAWSGAAGNLQGQRQQYENGRVIALASGDTISASSASSVSARYSPVVQDFDADGEMEIVLPLSNGEIGVYKDDLSEKEYSILTGATIKGQLAAFEFSPLRSGGGTNYDATTAWFAGGGSGIAAIVNYGSTNRFISYRYEGTSFVLKANVSIADSSGSEYLESQSVSCDADSCFVVVGAGEMRVVNPLTGAFSAPSAFLFPSAQYDANGYWQNTPVKVGPNTVVMKGLGADGYVHIYACGTAGCADGGATGVSISSCSACAANVSELSVGSSLSVIGFGVAYPVLWTEFYTVANVSHGVLKRTYVTDAATPLFTPYQVSKEMKGTGGEAPSCVSGVARADCVSGGEGVVLTEAYTATSGLVIASFEDAADLRFNTQVTTLSPFSGTGATGISTLDAQVCTGGKCLAFSGAVSSTNRQRDVWTFQNGLWTQATAIPGLGPTYNASCGMGVFYSFGADAPTTFYDSIYAVGGYGGAVYALRGKCTARRSGSLSAVWGNTDVLKYSFSSNSWSVVGSFSEDVYSAANYGHPTSIERMVCGSELGGCVLFQDRPSDVNVSMYNAKVVALSLGSSFSSSVFQPSGTILGGNVSSYVPNGYFEDADGNKYMSVFGGASSAIIMAIGGNPVSLVTLDSMSDSADNQFTGLYGEGNNVYWLKYPVDVANNCSNNGSSTRYSWDGLTSEFGEYVSVTRYKCPVDIRVYNGLYVNTRYREMVFKPTSVSQNHIYSGYYDAGFDDAGDYYVVSPFRYENSSGDSSSGRMMFTEGYYGPVQFSNPACLNNCEPKQVGYAISGAGLVDYSNGWNSARSISDMDLTQSFSTPRADFSWDVGYSSVSGGSVSYSDYTMYSCYSNSGMKRESYSVETNTYCPRVVGSVDLEGDGIEELVTNRGVFSTAYGGGRVRSVNGVSTDSSLAVVDVTGDTWTDFVFVTPAVIKTFLSYPPSTVTLGDSLGVSGLSCSITGSSVKVVPSGVNSPDPVATLFSATLLDKYGSVVNTWQGTSDDIVAVMSGLSSSGTYSVEYSVYYSGSVNTSSCSLSYSAATPVVIPTVNVSKACALGNDGEFTSTGVNLKDIGWVSAEGSGGYAAVLTAGGEYARFNDLSYVAHALSCSDDGMSVTLRVNPSSNGKFSFVVYGKDNGVDETLGAITYADGDLYVYNGGIPVLGYPEFYSGSYRVVELRFSRTNSTSYTVSVDGTGVSGNPLSLASGSFNGLYSKVELKNFIGRTDVDYVRTVGTTGLTGDTTTDVQKVYGGPGLDALRGCDNRSSQRDFNVTPPGDVSFEHVARYCSVVKGSGQICQFKDLQTAVSLNKNCYKEAFDYCVSVTFPRTGAFGTIKDEASGDVLVKDQQGLDGAAACNAALGVSVSYSNVLTPFFLVVWKILVSNLLLTFIIVFIVVVWIAVKRVGRK